MIKTRLSFLIVFCFTDFQKYVDEQIKEMYY